MRLCPADCERKKAGRRRGASRRVGLSTVGSTSTSSLRRRIPASRTSPDVMSFNLQEAVLTLQDPEDGILIDDELDIPSLAEREVEDYLERTSPPPPPLEASWELF